MAADVFVTAFGEIPVDSLTPDESQTIIKAVIEAIYPAPSFRQELMRLMRREQYVAEELLRVCDGIGEKRWLNGEDFG